MQTRDTRTRRSTAGFWRPIVLVTYAVSWVVRMWRRSDSTVAVRRDSRSVGPVSSLDTGPPRVCHSSKCDEYLLISVLDVSEPRIDGGTRGRRSVFGNHRAIATAQTEQTEQAEDADPSPIVATAS